MSDPAIHKPNVWKKHAITLVSLVALWLVWKADVFWHYYQFRQLCAAEGGLQVAEPLRKGAVWTMKKGDVRSALIVTKEIPNIAFIRVDRQKYDPLLELAEGSLLDIRYVAGQFHKPEGDYFRVANESERVLYHLDLDVTEQKQDRVRRWVHVVKDKNTGSPLASFTQVEFLWRTIPVWHWFGPSGQSGCPLKHPETISYQDIQQRAFKD